MLHSERCSDIGVWSDRWDGQAFAQKHGPEFVTSFGRTKLKSSAARVSREWGVVGDLVNDAYL